LLRFICQIEVASDQAWVLLSVGFALKKQPVSGSAVTPASLAFQYGLVGNIMQKGVPEDEFAIVRE
jgi:hypothetical protein